VLLAALGAVLLKLIRGAFHPQPLQRP